MSQPQVSKHLKVLREVDLVRCRSDGRRRMYCVNEQALQPVHEWLQRFVERTNEHYGRLDDHLVELQTESTAKGTE